MPFQPMNMPRFPSPTESLSQSMINPNMQKWLINMLQSQTTPSASTATQVPAEQGSQNGFHGIMDWLKNILGVNSYDPSDPSKSTLAQKNAYYGVDMTPEDWARENDRDTQMSRQAWMLQKASHENLSLEDWVKKHNISPSYLKEIQGDYDSYESISKRLQDAFQSMKNSTSG